MNALPDLGRMIYAGFATPRHSGGVAVLAQHVRLLCDLGVDACLWLPGAEPISWLDGDVATVHGPTIGVDDRDLLVLPEVPVLPGRDPAPGARKVIFSQNHFYTFAAAAAAGADPAAAFPDWSSPPGLWTVSAEARAVLSELFADSPVQLVRNHVDDAFQPRPRDRIRVTWLAKKRPREAALLYRLLRAEPRLAGVELCPLADVTHPTLIDVLCTTTVFVALGHTEGFGLPTAEALAAGCLVTGYDGGGGAELFAAPGAWPVPEQRPLLLRDRVVDLVLRADELDELAAANRDWLRARYSREHTRSDLLAALDVAAEGPGAAATATHPAAWLGSLGPNFTAYA